ncbi:MAG TPA: cyclic pyranopterin monophosphate synthase MoaC [Bacteroidales bacterium]|nr:cyclic pyranopterin monophosphate synthase MoaC [Bacteroidales bacterium]
MNKLSHIDDSGKARMVDVGQKPFLQRKASAIGEITLAENTRELIADNLIKKGDVLTIAEIAGIQAAKNTSAMIPLCHPLQISGIDVKASITPTGAKVAATVKCNGPTGVEMEALSAVSVALLTIYDMCKAVDKNMVIHNITLIEKTKE